MNEREASRILYQKCVFMNGYIVNCIAGMPGMTAYAGFYEVCSPKKGETSLYQLLLEQLVNL